MRELSKIVRIQKVSVEKCYRQGFLLEFLPFLGIIWPRNADCVSRIEYIV